jgi:uncharacterized protein YjiS (DUF1127 family)
MSAFEYAASCRHRSPQGIVARILARLGAIRRELREQREARIGVRQLQSLSDWQLKDIGLQRSEIWHRAGGISAGPRRSGHAQD